MHNVDPFLPRTRVGAIAIALVLYGMLAALSVLATPASAQSKPADGGVQTWPLPLRTIDGVTDGKVAVVRGNTGRKGHRFIVDKLWMTNPVKVTVMNQQPDDAVKLELIKFAWDKPVRTVTTGVDARHVSEQFRTQGEFLIHVSSQKEETPYQLVVWVGDEVTPELRDVVLDQATYDAGLAADRGSVGGGLPGGSVVPWIIAALLGALLVLAAVFVFRRKSP